MPGSVNFPPANPTDKPNQFQKSFFPFDAFSADDPNVTNPPGLTLISPWVLKGTFSGVGTGLTNAIVGTAAALASANPTLLSGQIGYESDTKLFKIGDGATAYNSLSYQMSVPHTSSGIGQVVLVLGTDGTSIVYPAGGTWMTLSAYQFLTSSAAVYAHNTFNLIGAGGATIMAARSSYTNYAVVMRIA